MMSKTRKMLLSAGVAAAVVLGIASPVFAAAEGKYEGTVSPSYDAKLVTGERDRSYGLATVSVNAAHSNGGVFWIEAVGGGRCSTIASVSPRVTANMAYTSSFTGGVQLWGQPQNIEIGPYYLSGYYRFNVR